MPYFQERIFITLIVLILCAPVFTQSIQFSANAMSGTVSDTQNYTRLSGDAYVKTDSMELRAGDIEMNGEDYRFIEAKDSITGTYIDAGFTFTCDIIRYDREKNIAILEGNVEMIDTENDVTLKAEYVEYDQNTEVALIQIDVEILQDDSVCSAAFALYRKSIQILELSGSPKITQGDDVFEAHEIIFNLDTEEISLIGKVKGTVTDASEAEEDGDDE